MSFVRTPRLRPLLLVVVMALGCSPGSRQGSTVGVANGGGQPPGLGIPCSGHAECTVIADLCHAALCVKGTCAAAPSTCSCVEQTDCAAKEDGNPCTGTLYCRVKTKTCEVNPASQILCDASESPCVAVACDPVGAVCRAKASKEGLACDDGQACTEADSCKAGVCAGSFNCVRRRQPVQWHAVLRQADGPMRRQSSHQGKLQWRRRPLRPAGMRPGRWPVQTGGGGRLAPRARRTGRAAPQRVAWPASVSRKSTTASVRQGRAATH